MFCITLVAGLAEGSNGVSLVGFENGFTSPRMNGVGCLEAHLSIAFFGDDGSQKKHVATVKVELGGLRKADSTFDREIESKFRSLNSPAGLKIMKVRHGEA